MKNNNDFACVLKEYINTLSLPIHCTLDYLDALESLVLYPLPGGKVDNVYMDGSRDVTLIFEFAVKSVDQQKASECLWEINKALSEFDLDLPSQNGSYLFNNLTTTQPSLNEKDGQGYYIYLQDITASLTILNTKGN